MALENFDLTPEQRAKVDAGELTVDGVSLKSTVTNKYEAYAPYTGQSDTSELYQPLENLPDEDEEDDDLCLGDAVVGLVITVVVAKGIEFVGDNSPRWIDNAKGWLRKKRVQGSSPAAIAGKPVVDHSIMFGLNTEEEALQEQSNLDKISVDDEQD